MKLALCLSVASVLFLFSCNNEPDTIKINNEDITNTVNKDGAVETSVSVNHLDSLHDILITKHKVWADNKEYRNIEYRDTIPALGIEHTVAENKDGDTIPAHIKKDYEIFITIK